MNETITRRPRKEYTNVEASTPQRSDLILPGEGPIVRERDEIEPVERPLKADYLDELAFNEEPVDVIIQRGSERNAPGFIPCWVQGKGIEVYQGGKWISTGWVRVGVKFTTKRKYAEVLYGSKRETVNTIEEKPEGQDPLNRIERYNQPAYPVTILGANTAKEVDWLNRLQNGF